MNAEFFHCHLDITDLDGPEELAAILRSLAADVENGRFRLGLGVGVLDTTGRKVGTARTFAKKLNRWQKAARIEERAR